MNEPMNETSPPLAVSPRPALGPRPGVNSAAGSLKRAKPDPRPVRFALGMLGLGAVSAITGAVATSATPTGAANGQASSGVASLSNGPATIVSSAQVQYIQLAPGQVAPPGATVIDAAAPKPITVVTRVPAPAQSVVTIRTTQSGTVLP